ncbi:MAG: pantetheine-phosphate adenylyltransferase [Candidatus Dadabacteria bacterium]|nr:MAG: pantetheine-phosphate adenylyltransferase [Candidatus Dadabacteria bacterium]
MPTIVYPGTFNPITNGHTDIVRRARKIFDRVILAIGTSPEKQPEIHLKERVELCREVVADIPGVEVEGFNELLVDYLRRKGTPFVLRGLRNIADFEYEFQMVEMNQAMWPELEYVFLAPSKETSFVSSTLVRQIAMFGGEVEKFVHPAVARELRAQYGKRQEGE